MIKNYIKIAWRNMMKNKTFSFINIFGLSIGLTCCMLISMYLYYELSYDSNHKNANRVYQLGTTFVKEGKEDRTANTPAPMARTMQMVFPEIEKSTRLLRTFSEDKTLLQYTDKTGAVKSFNEAHGYLADSTFFQVLTYDFIEGNPETALMAPNSLVLSEEVAKKIFGKESPLNKTVRVSSNTNGDFDFNVTGVFADPKVPTHIDARFFMSINGGGVAQSANQVTSLATNNMYYTYFLLKKGADAKQLEAKFPAFVDQYAGKDLKAMGFYKKQFLTPVRDVHLYANTTSNVTPGGSVTYLYIIASIAIFTLLIACINFMNLSTARSSKRSAEVGVRKVLGAEKNSLVRQFIGESILMSLIAFVFALVFAIVLLPFFSKLAHKEIVFSFEQHGVLLVGFFVLAILTGLIAGSYPAFYLSSFKPVKVLKGRISNSLAAVSLRKALVVFQFVISVGLIVASVTINNQMKYMQSKDLGFEKDQQVIIPLRSGPSKAIYAELKEELKKNPQILNVGASFYYPGIINPSDMPLYKEGGNMNMAKRVFMNVVDESFLQTLDIEPASGRLFSKDFPADTNFRVILNQQAIKEIGFKDEKDAVGKDVLFTWEGETYRLPVVGVVKDFHFKDLHSPIEPYGFQLNNRSSYNYMIAHAKTNDLKSLLTSMENVWRRLNPNEPFEYNFLDEDFQKNYEADARLAAIVRNFTVIAILISCLGLFGLATFSAEQRTKEIGVRKVLGASVGNVVGLLSKEFLKLVLIAVVIASPITWLVMNQWLQDFAYRTNISWTVFVITALIAGGIALFTISFQSIKAALANPVKSLRTE
ncbi:MAG TPA: ABC transporter permease [Chitinophagaceae bacterium]|nr:ABC transporter permease [Chitinophagaceae bacterium]